MKKIFVLDTTALIVGHIYGELNVTCNHILEEVKDHGSKMRLAIFLDTGKILVREPGGGSLSKATEISKVSGDYLKLSKADLHVLALAIEYRDMGYETYVVTDDFALQNILSYLGIKYRSIRRAIKAVVRWKIVCSKCGREYPVDVVVDSCLECGGKLLRKRVR